MKRNAYKRIDALSRFSVDLIEKCDSYLVSLYNKDVESDFKAQDSLLSLVYAIDERTGLPTGDLQYLVSDKANPQVKEFILANLMQDVSSAKNIAANGVLSDDDILELSLGHNESLDSYVNRLNESINKDKWLIDVSKKSVSDKSE